MNRSPVEKLEVAKRRALVMRYVNDVSANGEKLSYDDIASKMRADHWISARWPEYSATTARKDFVDSLSLVEDDVRSMSSIYLAKQLGIIDMAMELLLSFATDDDLKENTRIMALNSLGNYLEKEIRIFGNYPSSEINVNKRELTVNLDQFLKAQEQMRANIKVVEPEQLPEYIDADESVSQ